MLRVITLGSCSKFLTMVLSLSPQGCSHVRCILAEGHVQSLAEVSRGSGFWGRLSSCRVDQGGVSPDVQNRALLLVSAYKLSGGHHGGSRTVTGYHKSVMSLGFGYQGQPWVQ